MNWNDKNKVNWWFLMGLCYLGIISEDEMWEVWNDRLEVLNEFE